MSLDNAIVWNERAETFDKILRDTVNLYKEDQDFQNEIEAMEADAPVTAWQVVNSFAFMHELMDFFGDTFITFMVGFYGMQNFDQDDDNPPRYVLSHLLEQSAKDYLIARSAIDQRLVSGEIPATLDIADRMAARAIEPARRLKLLDRDTPVVTYLAERASTRIVPYSNGIFISLPIAAAASKGNAPSRDYLPIPHEIGHFVYWRGTMPGTDQFIHEALHKRLDALNNLNPWVLQWVEEMFCDAYALLVAGPVLALDFQDLVSSTQPAHFRESLDKHPIDILRPLIMNEMLRRMGSHFANARYTHAPNALDQAWLAYLQANPTMTGHQAIDELLFDVRLHPEKLSRREITDDLEPAIDAIFELLAVGTRGAKGITPWTTDLADGEKIYKLYEQFVQTNFPANASDFPTDAPWEDKQLKKKLKDLVKLKEDDHVTVSEWKPFFLAAEWGTEGPIWDPDIHGKQDGMDPLLMTIYFNGAGPVQQFTITLDSSVSYNRQAYTPTSDGTPLSFTVTNGSQFSIGPAGGEITKLVVTAANYNTWNDTHPPNNTITMSAKSGPGTGT